MSKTERIEALIAAEMARLKEADREDVLLNALERQAEQAAYEDARLKEGLAAYKRGEWITGEEFEANLDRFMEARRKQHAAE